MSGPVLCNRFRGDQRARSITPHHPQNHAAWAHCIFIPRYQESRFLSYRWMPITDESVPTVVNYWQKNYHNSRCISFVCAESLPRSGCGLSVCVFTASRQKGRSDDFLKVPHRWTHAEKHSTVPHGHNSPRFCRSAISLRDNRDVDT